MECEDRGSLHGARDNSPSHVASRRSPADEGDLARTLRSGLCCTLCSAKSAASVSDRPFGTAINWRVALLSIAAMVAMVKWNEANADSSADIGVVLHQPPLQNPNIDPLI